MAVRKKDRYDRPRTPTKRSYRVSAGGVSKSRSGPYPHHGTSRAVVRKLKRSAKGSGKERKARKFLLTVRKHEAHTLRRIFWLKEQIIIRDELDELADRFAGISTSFKQQKPTMNENPVTSEPFEAPGSKQTGRKDSIVRHRDVDPPKIQQRRRRNSSVVFIGEVVVLSPIDTNFQGDFVPKPELDPDDPEGMVTSPTLRGRAQWLHGWSEEIAKRQHLVFRDQAFLDRQRVEFSDELEEREVALEQKLLLLEKEKADVAMEREEVERAKLDVKAAQVRLARSRRSTLRRQLRSRLAARPARA